ncbi:hypothetical protein [Paenibacillus glycanilyticus]|uniref:O-antigen polysaccharide polymerase Wzy n=1 Tax=Paenibacillus glycanilyticus TaxID=126569 RepID=A0ABQ6G8V1_9BACL|nr:hypothetical protein [Paenibacillus glycanilyticus]GLX67374.1 hypothetical protein MU1_17190 [Paenibacillus glycanilyticus]
MIITKKQIINESKFSNPKQINISNKLIFLLDAFILFIASIIVFGLKDDLKLLPLIGRVMIVITIYMLFKFKGNKKLLFLFAILGFINISIGVSDLINNGAYVANWQLSLRHSEYNIVTAKSILLFMSVLNMMLGYSWLKNRAVNILSNDIQILNNPIISYVGTAALFIILLTGYSSELLTSSGEYVSNNNPIYEYAIVIYVVVWFFSGSSKIIKILLFTYSGVYSLYSLYFGDRSAAFLMLLLLFVLNFERKISVIKLFVLSVSAIFLANFIAIIRSGIDMDLSTIITNAQERGLYSDTVSYSYYTGITVTALHYIDHESLTYFLGYLKSLFLGTNSSEYGSLANYVSDNYGRLFNRGGGLFFTSFYAWFGYIGIISGAVLLGCIIRMVFSKSGKISNLYQILIVAFSVRWYLYNPTVLFRSVFVIATLVIILCLIFDTVIKKEKTRKKLDITNSAISKIRY